MQPPKKKEHKNKPKKKTPMNVAEVVHDIEQALEYPTHGPVHGPWAQDLCANVWPKLTTKQKQKLGVPLVRLLARTQGHTDAGAAVRVVRQVLLMDNILTSRQDVVSTINLAMDLGMPTWPPGLHPLDPIPRDGFGVMEVATRVGAGLHALAWACAMVDAPRWASRPSSVPTQFTNKTRVSDYDAEWLFGLDKGAGATEVFARKKTKRLLKTLSTSLRVVDDADGALACRLMPMMVTTQPLLQQQQDRRTDNVTRQLTTVTFAYIESKLTARADGPWAVNLSRDAFQGIVDFLAIKGTNSMPGIPSGAVLMSLLWDVVTNPACVLECPHRRAGAFQVLCDQVVTTANHWMAAARTDPKAQAAIVAMVDTLLQDRPEAAPWLHAPYLQPAGVRAFATLCARQVDNLSRQPKSPAREDAMDGTLGLLMHLGIRVWAAHGAHVGTAVVQLMETHAPFLDMRPDHALGIVQQLVQGLVHGTGLFASGEDNKTRSSTTLCRALACLLPVFDDVANVHLVAPVLVAVCNSIIRRQHGPIRVQEAALAVQALRLTGLITMSAEERKTILMRVMVRCPGADIMPVSRSCELLGATLRDLLALPEQAWVIASHPVVAVKVMMLVGLGFKGVLGRLDAGPLRWEPFLGALPRVVGNTNAHYCADAFNSLAWMVVAYARSGGSNYRLQPLAGKVATAIETGLWLLEDAVLEAFVQQHFPSCADFGYNCNMLLTARKTRWTPLRRAWILATTA